MSIFDFVRIPRRKRVVQDLSYASVLTMNMGKLVPFTVQEVLPNDKWKFDVDILVRLAPQLAPFFAEVNVEVFYFYVPNRIVFDEWSDFIYGGKDGNSSVAKPTVVLDSETTQPGSLADYLNFPQLNKGVTITNADALVFRAYNKIYNDWFRDENLIDEIPLSTAAGPDTTTSLVLLSSAWEKDYFTSSLPFPQRGPSVSLPFSAQAPVRTTALANSITTQDQVGLKLGPAAGSTTSQPNFNFNGLRGLNVSGGDTPGLEGTVRVGYDIENESPISNLYVAPANLVADLTQATASSIPQIRTAFQLQKWYERNARFGYRNPEATAAHFGIRPADYRLQRSEFLYSKKMPIITSEVLQTSSTDSTSPQANMSGHSFTAFSSKSRTKVFSEHGYLFGIMRILPRTLYYQGVPRKYTRNSRFDYAWPEFEHIGEQEVRVKEIYANASNPEAIFGYQGRYQEYRQNSGEVHGQFRTSLDFWHMGRKFDSQPNLNSDFVTANPTKRIFAVTDENEDSCWIQLNNRLFAKRVLSKRGEPGFIDHN